MTTAHPSSRERHPYEPTEVLPPGETLRETLDALDMSQAQLAARTGLSTKHINQIIQGQAVLTHETAISLERATGVPARFWNELESRYRDHLSHVQERKNLAAHVTWLKRMPIAALRKLGKITDCPAPKSSTAQETPMSTCPCPIHNPDYIDTPGKYARDHNGRLRTTALTNGQILCQLCFEYKWPCELHEIEPGIVEDACTPCAKQEAKDIAQHNTNASERKNTP